MVNVKHKSLLQVKLLDFAPAGPPTNPLLFSWEELGYQQQDSAAVTTNQASSSQETSPSRNGLHGSADSLETEPRPGGKLPQMETGSNNCLDSRDSGDNKEDIDDPVFKIVEDENCVQPNLPQYGVPYDMIEEGMYEDLLSKLQQNCFEQHVEPP